MQGADTGIKVVMADACFYSHAWEQSPSQADPKPEKRNNKEKIAG